MKAIEAMSHQIDPKARATMTGCSDDVEWVYLVDGATMTGCSDDDDDWVYLVDGDDGKAPSAAPAVSKGGGAVPAQVQVPAGCASGDVMEVVVIAGDAQEDGASGEEAYSESDDDSDYSNEGRLKKAYESDEDLDHADGDATEEEDAASDEDDYSGEGRLEKANESDEGLGQVDESESYHGTFDLTELIDYLKSITDHGKDIRKEVTGADDAVVVDACPADPVAPATNEHFDGAAADDDFSDYYNYHDDYHVGTGGEHNDGGLAYRNNNYGYGYSAYGGGADYYGYGGGGGYYPGPGCYGYGGVGYHAGLPPWRVYNPYYVPGVGLCPVPLPVPYALRHPYTSLPGSPYGVVSSPTAAAPPEPQQ